MFCNLNTHAIGIQANLTQAVALAQTHGFAGVDFSISEVADLVEKHGLNYVQDLFAAAKIRPGSWGFPVEFRHDEATWRDGLRDLPRLAETAKLLGCERAATWIMPCSNMLAFKENFDFHVQRLQPAARILADYGCRFGLEFVGPKTLRDSQQYPFIYTLPGMLELCQAMGTANVGLLLDSYHLYTSHGTAADVRQLTNHDIVTVHVNDALAGVTVNEQLDNVRALPGETGVIDMVGFLSALQAIAYDGPVTAEPFSQRLNNLSASEAAQETARAMRLIWQKAGLS